MEKTLLILLCLIYVASVEMARSGSPTRDTKLLFFSAILPSIPSFRLRYKLSTTIKSNKDANKVPR
jgi:hypothetical protein